jgi:ribonuclease P protein component
MDRLKLRADFLAAANGAKVSTGGFVLQARDRCDRRSARVGFTVSKKVGGAVERNRVRRRLREVVRLSAAERLRLGADYVLIGRRAALELPFEQLIADFVGAVGRVHQSREMRASAEGRNTQAKVRPANGQYAS